MTNAVGIDVSLYQRDITNLARNLDFVIVKASQADYPDPKAAEHFAQAAGHGVTGAYHWLDPEPSAKTQAAVFLQHAGPAAFLAVDCEGRLLRNKPHAEAMASDFIATVRTLDTKHRKILLYSSRGTWPWGRSHGEDGRWVADYGGDPNRGLLRLTRRGVAWTFWQNSDGNGRLDHDIFNGTAADLAKWIGETVPAPIPKPHDPGVTPVKFGTIYDPPKSLDVPGDTSVRDFTGVEFDKVGPTKLRVYGKADAHDGAFIVKVHTGHFFSDGVARDSYAVAIVPGGNPQ